MPAQRRSILPQAEVFLKDTLAIPSIKIKEDYIENYSFSPRDYNSMLTINADSINITVVASYDATLIEQIVKHFMEVDTIDEKEKESLYLDASGEIINIIMSLASPKYIEKGMTTTIGTPHKVTCTSDVLLSKPCSILNEKIHTDFGEMDINIISHEISTKTGKSLSVPERKKITVLVTDDSLMIRKKMKSMLETLEYNVILASNGKEAIEIYKEKKPDIVTMDLSMPLMNGFDALKHLIAIDPYAKVIMSTANGFSESVLASMKEGASGYILKPIRIDLLEETITQAINDTSIRAKKKKQETFNEI